MTVQGELVWASWQIGRRIREDVPHDQRAPYGQATLAAVAERLTEEYGAGFTQAALAHMVRFAGVLPNDQIVYALRTQLSWTHLRRLISIDDPLEPSFYTELCRIERGSTRTLAAKIDGMLLERTAISQQPEVFAARLHKAIAAARAGRAVLGAQRTKTIRCKMEHF